MGNPIIRRVNLGSNFAPLASQRTIGTFSVRVPANASAIVLLCDDGLTQLPLDRSQQFTFEGVNLAEIRAKGSLGDFLMVIGATRVL